MNQDYKEIPYCQCGRRWPDPKRKICGVCIAEGKQYQPQRPAMTGRNAVTVWLPKPPTAAESYHGRLMAG